MIRAGSDSPRAVRSCSYFLLTQNDTPPARSCGCRPGRILRWSCRGSRIPPPGRCRCGPPTGRSCPVGPAVRPAGCRCAGPAAACSRRRRSGRQSRSWKCGTSRRCGVCPRTCQSTAPAGAAHTGRGCRWHRRWLLPCRRRGTGENTGSRRWHSRRPSPSGPGPGPAPGPAR